MLLLVFVNKQKSSADALCGEKHRLNGWKEGTKLFPFGEILHAGASAVLEQHSFLIPVERLKVVIISHFVVAHHYSIHALGIYQRRIEGFEYVVADDDGVFRPAMEVGLRLFDIGDFGID